MNRFGSIRQALSSAAKPSPMTSWVGIKFRQTVSSSYAIQHHPHYWPDPEHFDPERFTPERFVSRHHYAYFPFSFGPRMCIGNSFAMMEAQLILTTIAQHYQLRMVPGHRVEPQALVSLRPKYGLRMTIHER